MREFCTKEDLSPYYLDVVRITWSSCSYNIYMKECVVTTLGQSLAYKALRQDYYWPTMKEDDIRIMTSFDKCHRFTPIPLAHPQKLTSMSSLWLFVV